MLGLRIPHGRKIFVAVPQVRVVGQFGRGAAGLRPKDVLGTL
jgi:hypothetical protein